MGADVYIVERMEQEDVLKARENFQRFVDLRNVTMGRLESEGVTDPYSHPDGIAAQEKVDEAYDAMYPEDGYFRDSYNNTSLFWTLGLSWWNDVGDLINEWEKKLGPRYPDEDYDEEPTREWHLPPEGIAQLRDMVATRTVDMSGIDWTYLADADDKEGWSQYYHEKYDRFLNFCDTAIENGWHMYLSI